ncbi:MAG: ribosomal RNA small subunit methyltransferase A, partial [Candidatus Eremiobacteraeota bacterium]|nr:ribosomal RNA small subunit methyltransferase A [Candidatus Eremiobacteraeota bacterium]
MEYSSPKRVLDARGLRPRKRLGQNFLVDSRFAARIAQALPEDAHVLEIGGGTGTLTAALAAHARSVDVLEIDRGLVDVLRERFAADAKRVRIVEADALDADLPALLQRHRPPRAICGNLPYSITTPLLERIVDAAPSWDCAVVMVQREYAKRVAARPGTPEYSSLSVYVRHHCEVEHLFDVGASGFYPAPAVASSVMRLRPKALPDAELSDRAAFLWIVRAAFAQRRKTLANSIAAQTDRLSRADV